MNATLEAQKKALEAGTKERKESKEIKAKVSPLAPIVIPTQAPEPVSAPTETATRGVKDFQRIGPPTKEQKAKALEMAAQGHTPEEISEAIGRKVDSVNLILKSNEVVVVPKNSMTYTFPLRKGTFQATFTLPIDLTEADANRLNAFISAMVEA